MAKEKKQPVTLSWETQRRAFSPFRATRTKTKELLQELQQQNPNIEKIGNYIDDGALWDAKDASGNTPLSLAAAIGNKDIFDLVYAKLPHQMLEPSEYGLLQAVLAAAGGGHLMILQSLSNRVDLTKCFKDIEHTPLTLAAAAGHSDVVQYLISKGAIAGLEEIKQDQQTAVRQAAANGQIETLKHLLNVKGDTAFRPPIQVELSSKVLNSRIVVTKKEDAKFPQKKVEACIHELKLKKNVPIILRLVVFFSVHTDKSWHWRCAYLVTKSNRKNQYQYKELSLEIYKQIENLSSRNHEISDVYLPELYGAVINDDLRSLKLGKVGGLFAAVEHNQIETLKYLLADGKAENVAIHTYQNTKGQSLLQVAAFHGHLDVVELLVEQQAVVAGLQGHSALQLAAEQGHAAVVVHLLTRTAPSKETVDLAFDSAIASNQPAVVSAMIANTNQIDLTKVCSESGNGYLHDAQRHGAYKALGVLLQHGVDSDVKNKEGKTFRELEPQKNKPQTRYAPMLVNGINESSLTLINTAIEQGRLSVDRQHIEYAISQFDKLPKEGRDAKSFDKALAGLIEHASKTLDGAEKNALGKHIEDLVRDKDYLLKIPFTRVSIGKAKIPSNFERETKQTAVSISGSMFSFLRAPKPSAPSAPSAPFAPSAPSAPSVSDLEEGTNYLAPSVMEAKEEGRTPFMQLIAQGDTTAVEQQLGRVDLNTVTAKGESALTIACQTGKLEIVKLLLDNGVSLEGFSLEKHVHPTQLPELREWIEQHLKSQQSLSGDLAEGEPGQGLNASSSMASMS
jgi:ankyrin repeat protein